MIDTEKGIEILNSIKTVMQEMQKSWFITDGTLLGLVRDGNFIEHDTDIDIGVFFEEWKERDVFDFIKRMLVFDLEIKYIFGDFTNNFEMSFVKNGIKTDFFFYREKEDGMIIFHAFKNGGRDILKDVITYEYRSHLIKNIKPMFFIKSEYSAPADPVSVLEAKYGADWRTPNKGWDWAYDPKNIRLWK